MMVRKKLAVVVAALGAFQSGVVSALGLGELALESSLNQPLNAEIKLLNVGELDTSQVLVRLAQKEDFDRAGISRDYFLSSIKFKVDIDKNGNGTIKLKTQDRVVEPYLNFLVEARWPSGRLLREYTVLLDLPVFSQAQPALAAQVATPVIEQVRNQPQASSTPNRASGGSSARQQLAGGQLQAGDEYRVRQSETLWEIAAKARPSADVSVQQAMVTIQQLNPKAFIKGNINTLKAGYVLRLPTESEIQRVSDSEAASEVAAQNRAWKTGEDLSASRGAQLDATSSSAAAGDKPSEASRLSIATPGSSTDEGFSDGEGAGGNASALRAELDSAEEQLAESQRANDEMASRLGDMEAKMATLQRLLELKEDQLNALQDNAGATELAVDADTEASIAETEAAAEAEMAAAEAELANEAEPAVAEPESQADEQPKPVAAEPKPDSFFDNLLSNPLYAGLGLGALALAVVAVVMGRRRKKDDDEELGLIPDVAELDDEPEINLADASLDDDQVEPETVADEDEFEGMSVGDFATDMDLAPEQELSFDEALEPATEVEQAPAASVQAETGDAIAEADIYVAYGRYQQAIDLLTGAIAAEPQRSDLYVKLLEVCVETRDKPAFQQHYTALQGLGDDAAIAQVKEMLSTVDGVSDWLEGLSAVASDFSDADMDAELIEGDTAEAPADELPADDDFDLDLDLDLEGEELDSFAGSTTTQFDVADLEAQLEGEEDDLDLEFDLDLGSTDEFAAVEAPSLDGELDLTVDTGSEELAGAEDISDQKDDLGLADLDLDGELDLELDDLSLDSDLGDLALEFGEDAKPENVDSQTPETEFDGLTQPEELDTDLDLSATALDVDGTDELAELSADIDAELELPEQAGGLELQTAELEAESGIESELEELELDALDGLSEAGDDLDLSSLEESSPLGDDDATVVGMPAIDISDLEGSSLESSSEDSLDVANDDFEAAVNESVSVDDEFDFLADADEVATKLDLARAYIDMGDTEGARDILEEVVQEGNEEQKLEAGSLIERID